MSSSKSSKKWKDKILEDLLKRGDIIEGSICKYHDQTTITNNSNDVPLRRERIFEKTVYRTSKVDRKNCKPQSDDDFSLDQRELIAEIDKKLKHLQSQKRCLQMVRERKKTKTWGEYLSANQPEEKKKEDIKEKFIDKKQRISDKDDFQICEVLQNLLERNRVKVTDSSTQMEPIIDSKASREKSQSPRSKSDRVHRTKNVSQNVRMTSSCSLISTGLSSVPFSKRARKTNSSTQAWPSYLGTRRHSHHGRSCQVRNYLSEKDGRGISPKNKSERLKEPQTVKTECKARVVGPQCRSVTPKAMKSGSGLSLEKYRNEISNRTIVQNSCRSPPKSPRFKVSGQNGPKGKSHPKQGDLDSTRITVKSQYADNASTQDSAKSKRSLCQRTESMESYSVKTMNFQHVAHSSSISSEMAEDIAKFIQAIKRFQSMSKHTPRTSSFSDGETLRLSQKYKNGSGRSSARKKVTDSQDLKIVKSKIIDDTTYILPDSEETADYIVLPYTPKEINVNRFPKEHECLSENIVNKATVILEDASSERSRSNSSISFDISLNIKSFDRVKGTRCISNQAGRMHLDSEIGSPRSTNRENRATDLPSEFGHESHLNDSQLFQEHQNEFSQKIIHSKAEEILSASASKPITESSQLILEAGSTPRLQEATDNQYVTSPQTNQQVPKLLKSERLPESSQMYQFDERCMSCSIQYVRNPTGNVSKSTQCCFFEVINDLRLEDVPKPDHNEMVEKPPSVDTKKDTNKDSEIENKPQLGLRKQNTENDSSHPLQNSAHSENVSLPAESFRGFKEQPNSSNAKYVLFPPASVQYSTMEKKSESRSQKQQTDPVAFHQESNSNSLHSRNATTNFEPFEDTKTTKISHSDDEKHNAETVQCRQERNASHPQNVQNVPPLVPLRSTKTETQSHAGYQKPMPNPVSSRQKPISPHRENVPFPSEEKSQPDSKGQNNDMISFPQKPNSSHLENFSTPTVSYQNPKATNKPQFGSKKQTPDSVLSHQKPSSLHGGNASSPPASYRGEKTEDKSSTDFKIKKTDLTPCLKEIIPVPFRESKIQKKSQSCVKIQKRNLVPYRNENVSFATKSFSVSKTGYKSQSQSVSSRQHHNSSHLGNVSSLPESLRDLKNEKLKSCFTKQKRYQSSSRQESCPSRSKNVSSISESIRVLKQEKKPRSGFNKQQKRYPDPYSSNSEYSSTENKSQLYSEKQTTDPVSSGQETNSLHKKNVISRSEPVQSGSQKQYLSPKIAQQSLNSESSDYSESSQISKPVVNNQRLPDERQLCQPKVCSSIQNTLDVHPKETKSSPGDLDVKDSAIMPSNYVDSSNAKQSCKARINQNNDGIGEPVESRSLSILYGSSEEEVFLSETRHDDFHVEGVDSELLKYIQYLQDRLKDCDEMVKKQTLKCGKERNESFQNPAVFNAKQQILYDGEKSNLDREFRNSEENWSTFNREKPYEPESPLESNIASESQLDSDCSYRSSCGAEDLDSVSDCSEIPPFTGCDCMKEGYYKIMQIAYKK